MLSCTQHTQSNSQKVGVDPRSLTDRRCFGGTAQLRATLGRSTSRACLYGLSSILGARSIFVVFSALLFLPRTPQDLPNQATLSLTSTATEALTTVSLQLISLYP